MTLLEAMVLQCPVAAYNIGYLSILLENGKCGYLTKEHTANGYANLIQQIIDEPNIVAKKTQRAYQRMKADFNCERMTEHYLNLYDNINNIFAADDSIKMLAENILYSNKNMKMLLIKISAYITEYPY